VPSSSQQGRNDRDTATGRLLRAYHEGGDIKARDRLVQLYLPLVESLAHRYGRANTEHDDLVQAGSIGLLNAIERYDRRRGEEFTAFAVPTVVGEIKRHIRDRTSAVRLPRPLQEAGARLPQARDELSRRLGRGPTESELAAELQIPVADLARLESAGQPADDPDLDHMGPANGDFDAREDRMQLAGAFRVLDPTEQAIVYLRFIKDLTRHETAEQLGLSEGQLSRRTQAALAKLRIELERVGSGAPAAAPVPAETTPPPAGRKRAAGPSEPASEGKPKNGHSGRLLLRMPQSLHQELAQAAEREEVSLNQFITNTLAASLSWHHPENHEGGGEGRQAAEAPRWLPAAIVTNLVVVAIAGIIAVILLVIAWQQGF
jgi:RNA polymerase sigma-B factor